MVFFQVYLFCFLSSLITISIGNLVNEKIFNFKNNNIEDFFIGIVILSFLSLFFNFFISLNSYFNTLFLIFGILWLFKIHITTLVKITKLSIIISLIAFLTFILDHANRPDAGLYHLPYISMLNEHKIIFGTVNLHFRFGHTSILQYLSAIFNNVIFFDNGILIPPALIYAGTLCFFFNEIVKSNLKIIKFISFCFLVYTLTSMNRYSEFGNDDPAHMFYFIVIIYFFKLKNYNFYKKDLVFKIIIFSTYCFLIKQFYIFVFIFPLYYLIVISNKEIIFNRTVFFCTSFIFLWILKNIIVSGCMIYPASITCLKNLNWHNQNETINVKNSSEAWAKAFPDRIDQSINEEKYVKGFAWINTWVTNHFYVTLKKITPFIIVISIVLLINFKKIKILSSFFKNRFLLFLLGSNLIFSLFWFFKFPTFRYGAAYLVSLLSLLILSFFYKTIITIKYKIKNASIIVLILLAIIIAAKNTKRILINLNYKYVDYPWPKKNSFTESNSKNYNIPYKINDKIFYYYAHPYSLCMYSISPCTNFGDVKLKVNFLPFNYYIFIKD